MPLILLSSPGPEPAADLRGWLAGAGFDTAGHVLGSAPPVDFARAAVAVVEVGDRADAAAAQTRRWRAELGDDLVPVVWLLPAADAALAARGFDSGADAVLTRPLDGAAFVAQVRAGARSRATAARVAARAAEARLLADQLRKAFAQIDRDHAAARSVRRALLPRTLPAVGAVRFAVCHRPGKRAAGDFHDIRHAGGDLAGFVIGDVVGADTAGGLIGVFAAQSAAARLGSPPGDVLVGVNRDLLGLGFDDRPLVAMLAGAVDARTGEVAVARAGSPVPVILPADGGPQPWAVPGPFLGTAEASYPARRGVLRPGDRLLLGTDGIRPDGDPGPDAPAALGEAAARHRHLDGQEFADAVAAELLAAARHDDDFTLMIVEMMSGFG